MSVSFILNVFSVSSASLQIIVGTSISIKKEKQNTESIAPIKEKERKEEI